MENAIKSLIRDQIELYKHQPEGSSAKKGEIYNEIKRLVIDLSYEKIEDYNSLYQTDEDDFMLQSRRDSFVDGFMEAINCFINNNGKELLYVAQKTAERTKKEIISKAYDWIKENIDMYAEVVINHKSSYPEIVICSTFEKNFKKAMES